MANKMQKKTLWLVETAMLSAIIIVMAFTPLGYLKTAGLEITFIMIPVVVGGIITGPSAGAVLGLVFGITSFIQCFGSSPFGATLLGINAFYTFLVCVPTRTLAGFLAGLIAKAISKKEKLQPLVGAAAASLAGPLLNTVLFMSTLIICFGKTDFIIEMMTTMKAENFLKFVIAFVGINGVVEAAVCFVVSTAVSTAVIKAVSRKK